MGSPLAPVLANIFMGFYESKCLNEYNLNKPRSYLRYVVDILAVFRNEQDSLSFLSFLNNKHPNIKFTLEKQVNHSIAFLDVFISGVDNQNLTLQTYHKLTYCNNWNSFHKDIESIKSNLIKNAYPPFLIDKVILKCPDHKFSSKDRSDVYYFKLQYIGNLSQHIKNKLSKLCKEFCKKILT